MLMLGELEESIEAAREKLKTLLENGSAFDKFIEFVEAQGGDSSILHQPEDYPAAQFSEDISADTDGFIQSLDPYVLGVASVNLGAGRIVIEDKIDHKAGIRIHKKIGDRVQNGDMLFTVYSDSESKLNSQLDEIRSAVTFGDEKPQIPELIIEVI